MAATEKKNADTVPEPTRAAVAARDTGCRWIGCDAPAAHTEVHHLIERHRGGTHHPDNLISFCRSDHVTAHGRGWILRLDSDSGALHAHRRGRYKWTTLPRGTPLAQPSDRDPPDDDPGTDAHGDPPPLLSHHATARDRQSTCPRPALSRVRAVGVPAGWHGTACARWRWAITPATDEPHAVEVEPDEDGDADGDAGGEARGELR